MKAATGRVLKALAAAAPALSLKDLDAFAADWAASPPLSRAALWATLIEAAGSEPAKAPAPRSVTPQSPRRSSSRAPNARSRTWRSQTSRSPAYAAVERERKRLLMRTADFIPLWLEALAREAGEAFAPAPAAARRSLAKLVDRYETEFGEAAVRAAAKAVSQARSFAYDVA